VGQRRGAFARFLRSQRGQSVVELALALPMMTFTLIGGADMARAFSAQLAVQNGARAAAESMALDFTPTGSEAASRVQDEMNRTPGVNVSGACTYASNTYTCGGATISITYVKRTGNPAVESACTGAADIYSSGGTSTVAIPCWAKVQVQYSWSTLIPWPGLPRTFAFDRTTYYRRYQ
jgi:Flp pilus assembly protein TadG